MDSIIARGLTFKGYHGVYQSERERGQRFRVDLEIFVDLHQAGYSDQVGDTIDYAHVFNLVEEIVTTRCYRLLEALAENIAQTLLRSFPAMAAIEVTVYKPDAPIEGEFEHFAVKIFRSTK